MKDCLHNIYCRFSAQSKLQGRNFLPAGKLVDTDGRTHGGLQVEHANILPVLLQQGHEEVDAHLSVLEDLLLLHFTVANGHSHAQNLLQLELHHSLGLHHLGLQGFLVGHKSRKLSGLVQTRAEQPGNLLNNRLGCEKSVVLLGQLLHELLVLVHLLQALNIHALHADLVSLLDMLSVPEHAHPHLRARNVGQLYGSTETLVFLGIVVLQTNLKLHGLRELPVLLLSPSSNLGDGVSEDIALKLTGRNHEYEDEDEVQPSSRDSLPRIEPG